MKRVFFVFALLFSTFFSLFAQDEGVTKVAVRNPMKGEDSEPITGIELSIVRSRFRDAVSTMSGIELIDRTDVNNLLAEMKFEQNGLVKEEDKKRLGEIKGVDIIVSLVVTKGFGYINIESSFLKVETGNVVGTTQSVLAKAGDPVDIAEKCVELAEKLTGIPSSSAPRPAFTTRPATTATDRTFTVNGVSFKMVFVKGGSMYLGCTVGSGECNDDEIPSHNVTLTDYYMGETEVTQALWKAVMGYNNNPSNWKGNQLPVEWVGWKDCQEFVVRLNSLLSSQLPQGYRFALPSEAQWEYAARGGQKSSGGVYAGSRNLSFVGWYDDNSDARTHEVKQKAPNELGLYDMSGNVNEWCEDRYSETFYSDNRNWIDPLNSYLGYERVSRGGSWNYREDYCCVSFRDYNSPNFCNYNLGFRLALVKR